MLLKYLSYSFSIAFLLITLFEFQFQLIAGGPFITGLFLLSIFGVAFLLSLIYLVAYRNSHKYFYLPFLALLVTILAPLVSPELNLDLRLHFLMNKNRFEAIDRLSKESKIYTMTDMLRYSKNLNDQHIGNELTYSSKNDLIRAFGPYIKQHNLDPEKLEKIRYNLQRSSCISFLNTDGVLIFKIDGMLDNEYGYVKSPRKIKLGDTIPPNQFVVVQLIDLGDGWYYFFTT